MRFLGYLFLLMAIGALVLDVLAVGGGEFQLRTLLDQAVELGVGDLAVQANQGFGATVMALPGVLVLGGVGVVFLILSSLFSSGD